MNSKSKFEYKKSEITWLPMIPAHWNTLKGKHLFTKMNRPISTSDEVVTCFRDGTVTLRKNRRLRGFTESIKEIGYQGIRKGDLVIHVMDAFAGAIGISDSDGKATPVYSVCKPKLDLNPSFYALIVREMARVGYITSLAKGIRERSTDFRFETFAAQLLPLPSIEEQNAIAYFIDWKTRQINKFIQKKKRLIELLKEQKQVIINQAVTRGLDSNPRLKPSGIDWLGDIPEHWKISRLRNIATVRASGVDKHTMDGEPPVRLCNYVDVYKNNEITDELDFMKASATPAEIANFKLLRGDVIITKDSEDWKDIGIPAYVPQTIDNLICGYHLSLIRPYNDLIDGMFLYTSLLSEAVADQFRISATGVTRFGLSQGSIKDVQIPLPPIAEQKAISEYVKIKNESINQVIARTQKEIQLIQEYRTRLISDAVTGQLDVRNIEISDIAEEDHIEETLEEEQEEESLELVGASDDD